MLALKAVAFVLVTALVSFIVIQKASALEVTTVKSIRGTDLSTVQSNLIKYALVKDGFVALTGLPGLRLARSQCFLAFAKCHREGKLDSERSITVELPDGSKRVTLAVHTGEDLGQSEYHPRCEALASALEDLRRILRHAGQLFAKALDHNVSKGSEAIFLAANNQERAGYHSVSEVLEFGAHLDHLHLYQKTGKGAPTRETLERHTDQGLFVGVVPAMSISLETYEAVDVNDGFEVEVDGRMNKIRIPEDAIFFMLGDGFTNWMGHVKGFEDMRGVPHRLRLNNNDLSRIWLGRMFFPPLDAFIKGQVFSEILQGSVQSSPTQYVSLGCSDNEHALEDMTKAACAQGEIYCWMACRSVQELSCKATQEPKCVNQNTGQIWTDESKHCFECSASCYPPEAPKRNESDEKASAWRICNANLYPTSMYMDGFTGLDRQAPCLVFLFRGWILDTPFKYLLGCIGAFAIGFTTELFILIRRDLRHLPSRRTLRITKGWLAASDSRLHSLAMMGLFFGQLVMAYLAMLLAMSFAILIFMIVLLGLSVGHWLFNFDEVPKSNEACCNVSDNSEPLLRLASLPDSGSENGSNHCCAPRDAS